MLIDFCFISRFKFSIQFNCDLNERAKKFTKTRISWKSIHKSKKTKDDLYKFMHRIIAVHQFDEKYLMNNQASFHY